MSVVDTSTWKPFCARDLFTLERPKARIVRDYEPGDMPFVASGMSDNGVSCLVAPLSPDDFDKGQCLTVSPLDGSCFWQSSDFLGRGGSGASVCILRSEYLTERNALFVASCVRIALSSAASYGNLYTGSKLLDAIIMLPATPDGEPDWAYMEMYMQQVLDREEMFAEHLASLTAEAVADGHVIDTSAWKAFKVGDLFDIQKGKRLTKADMVDGNYPFVGASAVSNGVTAFVGNDAYLHNGHCLTVCYNGSVGETFLQKEPFWASDDVNVLRPFDESVSDFALMFVAPCIRSLRRNYGYTNKWTSAKMAEDIIFLPATPDGVPDWAYMEQYMKDVMAAETLFADELDRVYCA